MKKKPYIVRSFLLPQHMMPYSTFRMKTRDLAIALAEVLLEQKDIHYITIVNDLNEEFLDFKKEIEI